MLIASIQRGAKNQRNIIYFIIIIKVKNIRFIKSNLHEPNMKNFLLFGNSLMIDASRAKMSLDSNWSSLKHTYMTHENMKDKSWLIFTV